MLNIDRLIIGLDKGVRTVFGAYATRRPTPGGTGADAELSSAARSEAAALMRVNHCGDLERLSARSCDRPRR